MRKPFNGTVCDGCHYCGNFNREMNTCNEYGSRRSSAKRTVTVDGKDWLGFCGYGCDDCFSSNVEVPKVCFDAFAKPYFAKDDRDIYYLAN